MGLVRGNTVLPLSETHEQRIIVSVCLLAAKLLCSVGVLLNKNIQFEILLRVFQRLANATEDHQRGEGDS